MIPHGKQQKIPTLQEKYLKDEIVFHLKRQYGLGAEEQYNKMPEHERWMFLGEKQSRAMAVPAVT